MIDLLMLLVKVGGGAVIILLSVYLIVRLSTYAYFRSKHDVSTCKKGGG